MKIVGKITGKVKNKFKDMKNKAKELIINVRNVTGPKTLELVNNERGSMDQMVWIIGSSVVVVLIIAVFMTLAPDTAEDIWDSFIDYAKGTFGI